LNSVYLIPLTDFPDFIIKYGGAGCQIRPLPGTKGQKLYMQVVTNDKISIKEKRFKYNGKIYSFGGSLEIEGIKKR